MNEIKLSKNPEKIKLPKGDKLELCLDNEVVFRDELLKEKNSNIVDLLICLEEENVNTKQHLSNQQQVIFALHKRGMDAIPSLINNLTNTKKVTAFLANSMSSDSPVTKPHVGVISAYIIELILGRENLIPGQLNQKSKKAIYTLSALGEYPENYIFWRGVIVKDKKEIINETDLPKIQKIYQEWWEKNKDEPIHILMKRWKKGERILDGKEYKWT